MPEGKRVYTKDGILIGEIVRAYISEFGVHVAKIKTVFEEFTEFEVIMTQLKPTRIMREGWIIYWSLMLVMERRHI